MRTTIAVTVRVVAEAAHQANMEQQQRLVEHQRLRHHHRNRAHRCVHRHRFLHRRRPHRRRPVICQRTRKVNWCTSNNNSSSMHCICCNTKVASLRVRQAGHQTIKTHRTSMVAWKSRLTLAMEPCLGRHRRGHHRRISIRVAPCATVFHRYPHCRHPWSITLWTMQPQLAVRRPCRRWHRVPMQSTPTRIRCRCIVVVRWMWPTLQRVIPTTLAMMPVHRRHRRKMPFASNA